MIICPCHVPGDGCTCPRLSTGLDLASRSRQIVCVAAKALALLVRSLLAFQHETPLEHKHLAITNRIRQHGKSTGPLARLANLCHALLQTSNVASSLCDRHAHDMMAFHLHGSSLYGG